jgi:hypothetical protein
VLIEAPQARPDVTGATRVTLEILTARGSRDLCSLSTRALEAPFDSPLDTRRDERKVLSKLALRVRLRKPP